MASYYPLIPSYIIKKRLSILSHKAYVIVCTVNVWAQCKGRIIRKHQLSLCTKGYYYSTFLMRMPEDNRNIGLINKNMEDEKLCLT